MERTSLNVNILGITLARGGSKGIKNKNIIKILDKPLIAYTIIEAKKSKLINNYIVSTDSPKIAKIAKSFNADVPFLRPKNILSLIVSLGSIILLPSNSRIVSDLSKKKFFTEKKVVIESKKICFGSEIASK